MLMLHLFLRVVIALFLIPHEDMPPGSFPDRPWDKGNNPKTAVYEWIKDHPEFIIDNDIDNKLLISVTSNGYLHRVG